MRAERCSERCSEEIADEEEQSMPRKAELTMIQDDSAHESGRRKPTMGQKLKNREREDR